MENAPGAKPRPASTATAWPLWLQPGRATQGWLLGALGVLIFALTIPMTRLASGSLAQPQLSAVFVAMGRAALAGLLSLGWLWLARAAWPRRNQWRPIVLSALGVVFGWPLFLGFAVQRVDATHAAVVSGLLPISTAVMAALLLRQRPSAAFWACALLGTGLVLWFAAWNGSAGLQLADGLLLAAVLCSGFGYVQGAKLTVPDADGGAPMAAEQVISWVLVVSLPITLPLAWLAWPQQPIAPAAWGGFLYLAVFSMWLGFFAWYRGLAMGGVMRVSQVQLVQPFLSLWLAVPVLGESVDAATAAFSLAVMATVFLSKRLASR